MKYYLSTIPIAFGFAHLYIKYW